MKTILVPTDLSTNANNALKFANQLAKSLKAKIVLLYVYVPSVSRYNTISGLIAEEIVSAKVQARKKMEKICEKYIDGKYDIQIEVHDPVETILAEADKIKSDLIIMGTHGATGLKKLVFGSNTAKVISQAKRTVLAVPSNYKAKKLNKLICASDLKDLAKEVKAITPFAKAFKLKTEVLFLQYALGQSMDASEKFKGIMKKAKIKNVSFVEKKVTEKVKLSDSIANYVNKNKSAIFAIFPEDKSFLQKLIYGSNSQELAYHLKIPMLSIRRSQL